jgi:hypothetical protein
MRTKTLRVVLLTGLFFFSLIPFQVSTGKDDWWSTAWSYRQELPLGFLAGASSAANQPIDMTVQFDSPCWAQNETRHSVRVLCQSSQGDYELESQLYDLMYSDETHITTCNLVFLVPPEVDGTERYYVYYDEAPTPAPGYPDHVSIVDSSYYYEPIPGYPLESHFYKIIQDNTIPYVVAQEGTFLWYTTSQCVTKLLDGSTEVAPKNGEVIASFEYAYFYGFDMWEYSSTSQKLISKEILCDGNLMVSCKILSRSTNDDLQTTAVYTYYYCPTPAKRIQVHVMDEALKDCQVYEDANTDGEYVSMQCGGIQSASIPELNFGEIYPYTHFYSEQDTVEQYPVDLHPEYSEENPVIWSIQTADDVDLGKNAWVSFDEGASGTVHAVIFSSSSVVKAGEGERDGIQLKAYESNYPHLPGLDYTIASVECTRNTYEKNVSGKDMIIPKGFIAEFDVEFFSAQQGGYTAVETEASLFQALVPLKPSTDSDHTEGNNTPIPRHALTVSIHDAFSFPLGSIFSAITGRDFSYLTIEAYRENTLVSSGTAGRLPLNGSVTSDNSSLKDRLRSVLHLFDFRNISLWKQFSFQSLEEGQYVIKVFKENPRFGKQRRFIGAAVIDLSKDSHIHVFCKLQGSCVVTLVDQNGKGIKDAEVILSKDAGVIAHNTTNNEGIANLFAPCQPRGSYQLMIFYQGFEVLNESIRLRSNRMIIPLKKSVEIDQYTWGVQVQDLWGLSPEIDVIPRLTSTEMQIPNVIFPTQTTNNFFEFSNMPPATYRLQIQYKSFTVDTQITIPSEDCSLVFPATYPIIFHVFDTRGSPLGPVEIELSRGGKTQKITTNGSQVTYSIPPGLYKITVRAEGNVIGQRPLNVVGERTVDLITNQEPFFPLISYIISSCFFIIGFLISLKKKEPQYFLFFVIISVFMVALLAPWWSLQGSSGGTQIKSILYLIPLNLVSTTTAPEVTAGELSFSPEIFQTIMRSIPIITLLVAVLMLLGLTIKWLKQKKIRFYIFIGAFILFLSSFILFILAMSAFAEVGIGSFIGQGTMDVSIQGEDVRIPIVCDWGPSWGFWLYMIAGFLIIPLIILPYEKKNKRK